MSQDPANPASLRRLQLIELEVLAELSRLCDQLSLRWFVIGGTLLGAVRHGGFIPWDDDIDVGIPRPDYERFEAAGVGLLDGRFAWQSPRTNLAYPFMYGKLARVGTLAVEGPLAALPIRHAIAIDVFPLDGAPSGALARRVHEALFKVAASALGARIERTGFRRALALLLRLVPRRATLWLIASLSRRIPYDASEYVVNAGGAWGYARECQPRARLGVPTSVAFEHLVVPAPNDADAYLTQMYGDYRRLPPPDERRSRHLLIALRFGDEDQEPGTSPAQPPAGATER